MSPLCVQLQGGRDPPPQGGGAAVGRGVTGTRWRGGGCRTPGTLQPVALTRGREPLITYSNSVHHFCALRKRRAGSKIPAPRPGRAGS